MSKKVLLAGETWVMHTIHQKGFDHFTTTAYQSVVKGPFERALRDKCMS